MAPGAVSAVYTASGIHRAPWAAVWDAPKQARGQGTPACPCTRGCSSLPYAAPVTLMASTTGGVNEQLATAISTYLSVMNPRGV